MSILEHEAAGEGGAPEAFTNNDALPNSMAAALQPTDHHRDQGDGVVAGAQQLVAEGKPIPFRPVAELFPLLADTAFDDMCRSILRQGLQEPIVLHPDGSILDGRYRGPAAASWTAAR
jgi:hypothetical protein